MRTGYYFINVIMNDNCIVFSALCGCLGLSTFVIVCILFSIVNTSVFIGLTIADIVILIFEWEQTCDMPLRIWLIINLVLSALSILFSIVQASQNKNSAVISCNCVLVIFHIAVLTVGAYMLIETHNCKQLSEIIYYLVMTHVISQSILYLIAFIIVGISIFIYICLIVIALYAKNEYDII